MKLTLDTVWVSLSDFQLMDEREQQEGAASGLCSVCPSSAYRTHPAEFPQDRKGATLLLDSDFLLFTAVCPTHPSKLCVCITSESRAKLLLCCSSLDHAVASEQQLPSTTVGDVQTTWLSCLATQSFLSFLKDSINPLSPPVFTEREICIITMIFLWATLGSSLASKLGCIFLP